MICSACGKDNPDGLASCEACGHRMELAGPIDRPEEATLSPAHTVPSAPAQGADDPQTLDAARTSGHDSLPPPDASSLDAARTLPGARIRRGRVLAGQFRILADAPLGAGGMGQVWLAEDAELGVPVALKMLPPWLARNSPAVEDLRREAAIGRQLAHPNICRLYGCQTDGDLKFVVMEYVEGQTLAQRLAAQEGRPMGRKELLRLADQVAAALDYAHSVSYTDATGRTVRGVAHGDIKPQNIMITPAGQVKLVDFGIARQMHNTVTELTGRVAQTPLYASPEQFRGERIGPAGDIYSFAVVLYECAAGRRLVSAHGDVAWQILHRPYPPIEHQTPALNAALAAALDPDPTRRPATAAELRRQLTSRLPLPPPGARRVSLTRLVWLLRAAVRRRSFWIGAGLFLAGVALAWTVLVLTGAGPGMSGLPGVPAAAGPEFSAGGQRMRNSAGMTFVRIRPGSFMMGGAGAPARPVTLTRAYYLAATEVTQGQWRAVMGTQPWAQQGGVEIGLDYPAVCVTWDEADRFCRRLAQAEGQPYRLPTEAEWEFACTSGQVRSPGDESGLASERTPAESGRMRPSAQVSADALGLHAMLGNVAEWCQDWYAADDGLAAGVDPRGPASGVERVVRGGSFLDPADQIRPSARRRVPPTDRRIYIGFRPVVQAQ